MSTARAASVLHTRINYWPAMIDMLTSLLMFFLLIYFVEHNFSSASAELAIARSRQAQFEEVFAREFRSEITSGEVSYSPDLNALRVQFGEGVLFEQGQFELLPAGRRVLGRLATVFHALDAQGVRPYERIQIEGHTDNLPARHSSYPRDNWELSTARAISVLHFLTRDAAHRVDDRPMSVNGYADKVPIATRRDLNRRIEIRIYFSGHLKSAETPR